MREQAGNPDVTGYITCSFLPCPNPTAVDELLEDNETQHVVVLRADDFTVRHPLRERLGDELMECRVHEYIAGLDGPPRLPGRYRVSITSPEDAASWSWRRLGDA